MDIFDLVKEAISDLADSTNALTHEVRCAREEVDALTHEVRIAREEMDALRTEVAFYTGVIYDLTYQEEPQEEHLEEPQEENDLGGIEFLQPINFRDPGAPRSRPVPPGGQIPQGTPTKRQRAQESLPVAWMIKSGFAT